MTFHQTVIIHIALPEAKQYIFIMWLQGVVIEVNSN